MRWPSRQIERRQEIIDELKQTYSFVIDLTHFEDHGIALEGTGALIFDRTGRKIFMSRSDRSNEFVLDVLISQLNDIRGSRPEWEKVCFDGVHGNGNPIYHTNVILGLTPSMASIATHTIPDAGEKQQVTGAL